MNAKDVRGLMSRGSGLDNLHLWGAIRLYLRDFREDAAGGSESECLSANAAKRLSGRWNSKLCSIRSQHIHEHI